MAAILLDRHQNQYRHQNRKYPLSVMATAIPNNHCKSEKIVKEKTSFAALLTRTKITSVLKKR